MLQRNLDQVTKELQTLNHLPSPINHYRYHCLFIHHTRVKPSWHTNNQRTLCLVCAGCSLFLASFPFFSLFPGNPIDRVSPNCCLEARHEADSFEPAEWSERLTSGRAGWLSVAAVGPIPALAIFFLTYIFSPFYTKLFLPWRFQLP